MLCYHWLVWYLSTAERAFVDVLQDRRYWIIHIITIPSLFIGGLTLVISGFVYKLFGVLNLNKYFDKEQNSSISLINDRFSICNSISDLWLIPPSNDILVIPLFSGIRSYRFNDALGWSIIKKKKETKRSRGISFCWIQIIRRNSR